jgi:3-hydroxymyristoyl/3-hydroxydecanoyl-(acyl carrier protein) dehydratase
MLKDILDLIPQRPPMVMINQLISCEGPVATGRLKLLEGNVFIEEGKITESGMIEAMAQTAAARTGLLLRSKSDENSTNIPVGVIGSIRDFQLFFFPAVGQEMKMKIEVMHEFLNASVIKGTVEVNGKLACTAELKIFLTEDNPADPP